MLASFPVVQLAQFTDSISPQNSWYEVSIYLLVIKLNRWLGEKYDGSRCYWNPELKELYQCSNLSMIAFDFN